MLRPVLSMGLALLILLFALPRASDAQRRAPDDLVALAYVKDNIVTLADRQGEPLMVTGPELSAGQSARLFWSPDGGTLYIATREGLFVTSAFGGAATRLPGDFGLTVVFARHGGVLYNLDVGMPQAITDTISTYPLRETNLANLQGGRGRLLAMIGNYQAGTAQAVLSHAAALYARDGGLLVGGRPKIWANYGNLLYFSCCFPNPGMSVLDLSTAEIFDYDRDFITSAAATNGTNSRLAGPSTGGYIRVIDLVSGGVRDYSLDIQGGLGVIERVAWSQDDTKLYFISRETPRNPLEVLSTTTYPADTRSAYAVLWELNLITGVIRRVADIGDVYGIPSLAITPEYLFFVAVERNQALIDALNNGSLPPDVAVGDPALEAYNPRAVLWRVTLRDGQLTALSENIWGVVARP